MRTRPVELRAVPELGRAGRTRIAPSAETPPLVGGMA